MELGALKFGEDGLVPVVVADAHDGDVLTLAWANREALERTLATGETHLFSRSRKRLWRKGEQSGYTQRVVEVVADCDGDAVLYRVVPNGPACHTGAVSCFHEPMLPRTSNDGDFLRAVAHLRRVLRERKTAAPEDSYVAKLYAGGVDRIGKKIGEEATEVVIAAKNADDDELVWEAADLFFHLLVLLEARGVPLDRIGTQLLERAH
ncbi:MAG TPA: bifunctional phosphoribosyl-AMP cyclohydrolase/phosphoribosyl-ATP diphosphatase HisIE [Candidatus Tyrphobacter sp.]